MAGVVDPDYTGNLGVVLHNFGSTPQTIQRGDRIAQLIPEKAALPDIKLVKSLKPTERGSNGFGSTEAKMKTMTDKIHNPSVPILPSVLVPTEKRRQAAPAAKAVMDADLDIPEDDKERAAAAAERAVMEVEAVMLNKIETDLQVYF